MIDYRFARRKISTTMTTTMTTTMNTVPITHLLVTLAVLLHAGSATAELLPAQTPGGSVWREVKNDRLAVEVSIRGGITVATESVTFQLPHTFFGIRDVPNYHTPTYETGRRDGFVGWDRLRAATDETQGRQRVRLVGLVSTGVTVEKTVLLRRDSLDFQLDIQGVLLEPAITAVFLFGYFSRPDKGASADVHCVTSDGKERVIDLNKGFPRVGSVAELRFRHAGGVLHVDPGDPVWWLRREGRRPTALLGSPNLRGVLAPNSRRSCRLLFKVVVREH